MFNIQILIAVFCIILPGKIWELVGLNYVSPGIIEFCCCFFLQPTCEPFDEVQFEAKDSPTDKWRGEMLCSSFSC